jgi:hypothetical protein
MPRVLWFFSPDFCGIILAELQIFLRFDLRLGGYIPYGMRLSESHFPYGFFFKTKRGPSREELEDAWELLEKTSRLLKDQLEYLPASGCFEYS